MFLSFLCFFFFLGVSTVQLGHKYHPVVIPTDLKLLKSLKTGEQFNCISWLSDDEILCSKTFVVEMRNLELEQIGRASCRERV